MQLSDLQAAIQALGYGTDTAALQVQFINDTYREVCSQKRWPFLEAQDTSISTTIGVNAYSLSGLNPTWRNLDAVRMQQVSSDDYWNLDYMEPQEFRDSENIDRDQGTPAYWSYFNGELHLYPYPDDVYNLVIDYVQEVTPLANSTDVPVLPTDYHDLLVWGAIRNIAFRERDWLGRQFAQTEFEQRLSRMNDEYLIRQRQTDSHVRRSGSWDTKVPYPFVPTGW